MDAPSEAEVFSKPRRFELIDEYSYKFWEISVEGKTVNRRFGTIGKPGRRIGIESSDLESALLIAERLVVDKLLDGYQEVVPQSPDGINFKALARLERRESDPSIKKAIRLYAQSTRKFCVPDFLPLDASNHSHRISDQIVGGLPYINSHRPWPINGRGRSMQFIAQIDLGEASRLLEYEFGSGLLQVWADDYEDCEEFMLRRLSRADLGKDPIKEFPEDLEEMNLEGLISLRAMQMKAHKRISWRPAELMHYPNPWQRVCGRDERVEVIDPSSLMDPLEKFTDDDGWGKSLYRPLYQGLKGKRFPHAYLGGYPFAEGNGWSLHHPEERSLINIWCNTGIVCHVCVSVDKSGEFRARSICSR